MLTKNITYQTTRLKKLIAVDETQVKNNGCYVIGETDYKCHESCNRIYAINALAPTINTMQGGYREPKVFISDESRVRKLTPLECWRLMGFSDKDFTRVQFINSNSQLYKQAGNSIVVNVLEAIFKEMLETENE